MLPSGSNGGSLAVYREWAARQQGGAPISYDAASHFHAQHNLQTYSSYSPMQPAIQPTLGYIQDPFAIAQAQRQLQLLQLQNRLANARKENIRYKQEIGRSIIQQPQSVQYNPFSNNPVNDYSHISNLSNPMQAAVNESAVALSARNFNNASHPATSRLPVDDRMVNNRAPTNVPFLKIPESKQMPMSNNQVRFSQDDEALHEVEHNTKQQPSSRLQPANQRKLNNLNENLNQIVQDNNTEIEKDKTKLLSKAKQQQQEKKNANHQARQDIESLLKKKGQVTKIPLWRHRLQGNANPPRESIMGGKKLFRAIVFSVLGMLIGPARTVFLRKAEKKEMNSKEFVKTLHIVTEAMDDWLSKVVQLPIASIVHDDTVDFDPKESFVNGSTIAFRNRMIQLKVRVKAIFHSISSSSLPPPHIISFLVTLIEDGNYFPHDYFFDHERKVLDFDGLGATRDMLPIIPMGAEEQYRSKVKEVMKIPLESGEGVKTPQANAIKLKLFLINFLLVRALVSRIVLSPWQFHICKQPTNRYVRKGILNLRILASVIYEMLRTHLNHNLPLVMTHQQQLQEQMKLEKSDPSNNANMDILSSISQKQDTSASQIQQAKVTKGIVGGILKVLGVADTTPGYEDFHQGSIEFKLLRPRMNHYETMSNLHMMLMSTQSIASIEQLMNDWSREMLPPLNDWINQLVVHVAQQLHVRRTAALQSPRANNMM